jgi:hypothetical protein
VSALDVSPAGIAGRLRTQDNRCTREPAYVVQQKHRVTGLDPRFCCDDEIAWWNGADMYEAVGDERARLEAAYQETGDEPDAWTRTGARDTWEFVTVCLTEAAALAYIEANAHRLNEPRVFVESFYRNEEMIAVRQLLAEGAPR